MTESDRGRRPGSPDGPAADADLAARYQAGDRAALDQLLTRYRRFARARARAYFVAGGDAEDLEQEALIALVKAARDHRPQDGPFRPFADLCITRGLVSAIRRANRQKHRLLTHAVSLSGATGRGADGDDEDAPELAHRAPGPEDVVVAADHGRALGAEVVRRLSPLERQVLALILDGRSYRDVAEELHRSAKAVDNALQRIKHKLAAPLARRGLVPRRKGHRAQPGPPLGHPGFVVAGEARRDVLRTEPRRLAHLGRLRDRVARCLAGEDVVQQPVVGRVVPAQGDRQQAGQPDLEPHLLLELAHGGVEGVLSLLDEAARQVPLAHPRLVGAAAEQHTTIPLGQDGDDGRVADHLPTWPVLRAHRHRRAVHVGHLGRHAALVAVVHRGTVPPAGRGTAVGSVTPVARSRTAKVLVQKHDGPSVQRVPDELVVEEPMEIRLDDHLVTTTMRTPGNDYELAAGFLFTDGHLAGAPVEDVRYCALGSAVDSGFNVVSVGTGGRAPRPEPRLTTTTSSCGLCGSVSLADLADRLSPLPATKPVPLDVLAKVADLVAPAQDLFGATGGVHTAAAFDRDGQPVLVREDVGRHNAVDKVVGRLLLDGRLPAQDLGLFVSGRASFEIVQKAWAAGFGTVLAVSAPTSLAVETARTAGMTLVGFARGDRCNVYSPG